jgi:NAD-dependent SIR2 family protein deacetylase
VTALKDEVPGHVFVVKADVTTIDCDAWLCPTDHRFKVNAGFGKPLGLPKGGILKGYHWPDEQRAIAADQHHQPNQPLAVLGDVGRSTPRSPDKVKAHIEDLLPVIGAYVSIAVERCDSSTDGPLRLALPLIGTGHGGLSGVKGDTITPLLDELEKYAKHEHVDFVLCTNNELAWSAVQSARKSWHWDLTRDEEELADYLAERARTGHLVLFIGAGVSLDAGLPSWKELLESLYPATVDAAQKDKLKGLDFRDQATLIEQQLGGRELLVKKLRQEIERCTRIGLTHCLLASLDTQEAVTTNYDDLFERACAGKYEANDEALTVLPYGRVVEDRPWLLKLHGSLDRADHIDHIVLTRRDYMDLARDRSALFGIVQALLVTKHLLFVGYSLSDEDFNQLVYEIRSAIGPAKIHPPLGSVLMVEDWPLATTWCDILQVLQVGKDQSGPPQRRLQILLDRVAHLATPHHSYLLDESFKGLLEPDEHKLAEKLRDVQQVVEKVLQAVPDQPTAKAVGDAIARFGSSSHEAARGGG